MIQKFQTHDGVTLAYRDQGAGLPVLCLAGLTRNSTDFDYLAPLLPDIRLIRLDYRGRGQSDWADPATYTWPTEARDALALLDHLGISRVAIIGTSRGGMIAMHLAATAKDRITGVCLNDIGPVLEVSGLAAIASYIGKNPVAKSLPDVALARARMMTGFANVPDARWMQEAQKHYIDTGDGLTINYDPGLASVFSRPAPVAGSDLWSQFDAMDGLPLALIRGANSDILSADVAAQMQRRRPDMIFADVPDRGHVPFLDEPEAIRAIHAWLAAMQ